MKKQLIYVSRLQIAASGCEYSDSLDGEVIQTIIQSYKMTARKRFVFNDTDRSLTNVFVICRQKASIEKQMREMNAYTIVFG